MSRGTAGRRAFAALLLFGACAWAQGVVTTIAGSDYVFPDDGKPALQAHLVGAYGMAFDSKGSLYFVEGELNQVMKLDSKGIITVAAGDGLARFAGDGGPARAASLSAPASV